MSGSQLRAAPDSNSRSSPRPRPRLASKRATCFQHLTCHLSHVPRPLPDPGEALASLSFYQHLLKFSPSPYEVGVWGHTGLGGARAPASVPPGLLVGPEGAAMGSGTNPTSSICGQGGWWCHRVQSMLTCRRGVAGGCPLEIWACA